MRVLSSIEEHFNFYSELGIAFTQWATVELALFEVFAYCSKNKDRKLLATTFFSIENFRSKLQVTDEIVKYKINKRKNKKSLLGKWVNLHNRVSKASRSRNKLAHYQVIINTIMVEKKIGRYQLKHPLPIHLGSSEHGIAIEEILDIRTKFSSLFIALFNFRCKLSRLKSPFPATHEQPSGFPKIEAMIQNYQILPIQ